MTWIYVYDEMKCNIRCKRKKEFGEYASKHTMYTQHKMKGFISVSFTWMSTSENLEYWPWHFQKSFSKRWHSKDSKNQTLEMTSYFVLAACVRALIYVFLF